MQLSTTFSSSSLFGPVSGTTWDHFEHGVPQESTLPADGKELLTSTASGDPAGRVDVSKSSNRQRVKDDSV